MSGVVVNAGDVPVIDISERFSEKKKRGRPRAFPENMESAWERVGIGLDCRSRRGKVNHYYTLMAIHALRDGMREGGPFVWLGSFQDMTTGGGTKHRATILAELGRLRDEDAIRDAAEFVCQQKPRAAAAAATIRAFRLGHDAGASAQGLGRALCRALDAYMELHPGTDMRTLRKALGIVKEAAGIAMGMKRGA